MAQQNENNSESAPINDLLDYKSARRSAKKGGRVRVVPGDAERFSPTPEDGLTEEQAAARHADGLINASSRVKGRTYLRIIASNLFTYLNFIIMIIFIAMALVVDFAQDWSKFLFVVIAFTNTVIGIVLEIRSKMTIDRLKIITAPTAVVVRGGAVKPVPVRDVVLDDIIYLETGKQICADSVVVKGECEVNESMLTGESVPVRKKVGDIVYSGSFVTAGNCRARVDKIGDDNYMETLASYAKKYKKPKSELNNAINLVIKLVSIAMIPIAVLLIVRTCGTLLSSTLSDGVTPAFDAAHIWGRGGDFLIYRVITTVSGSIIGMVPTGMFLLTSVALALSVIRLAKRRTLVQNIYCIEMLARVDVLCLDKTGTITDGSMSVREVVQLHLDSENGENIEDVIGSMLTATGDNNQTAIALGTYFGYNPKFTPKASVPFSSARKLSAVTFEDKGTYLLGAPEFVLTELGVRLKRHIDNYAAQGYRVMCLAHTPVEIRGDKVPMARRPLCLIVIEDRIRDDAVETIKWFKENDVAIKVISGDNPITVSEVARRVGVADADKYISLEGLSTQEVVEAANRFTVFGRVTPEQKSVLVRSMKSKGHTVAMTGDGVNDILAMRQADCAVSIASGAEAARNVAHIVLMDNNFTSMPDVVVEGRRVINNVAKSSSLYLTKTFMTILLSILTLTLGIPYFFTTDMTLMYEVFITAIPSLFLALQTNKERVQGRFMTNMLKNSIPGGVTMSVAIMSVYIYWVTACGGQVPYDAHFCSMVTLTMTFAGFFILFRLSQPLNAYRVLLLIVTFGLCVFAASVLGSMFGITYTEVRPVLDGSGAAMFDPATGEKLTETVMTISLQDWFFMSTVALASYGAVCVLYSILGAINISTQKVEVEEAAEEKEREEELRMLEAIRESKRREKDGEDPSAPIAVVEIGDTETPPAEQTEPPTKPTEKKPVKPKKKEK